MSEYKFLVETKEAGQRRKYGDSYYHYIVESSKAPHIIEAFCRNVLKPSIPLDKDKDLQRKNPFETYCTDFNILHEKKFLEEGMNKVEYKVTSPSTH